MSRTYVLKYGRCGTCTEIWPIERMIEAGYTCVSCGRKLAPGSVVAVTAGRRAILTPCTPQRAQEEVEAGRAEWIAENAIKLVDNPSENRKYRRLVTERDGNECLWCGNAADTLDHLVPRSKGGRYRPENLILACRACNGEREDMTVEEYLAWRENEGKSTKHADLIMKRLQNALCLPTYNDLRATAE